MPDLGEKSGLWKRYVIGALLVIVAAAAATSVAAFSEVDKISKAFGGQLDLGNDLAEAPPGKPQTILLIGSDRRSKSANDAKYGAASHPRSDTMILVRLDPKKDATALLSLPRDLKVDIPGHGVEKLNAAYSIGGTRLTLRTIKQFTGLRVNHVINVDFRGFRDAVDAIHCVYVDVDRRYFNDNADPSQQYATINIDPGYQKLCGQDALDYVRYRHTDSDITRAARQQDFLREAKQQVGAKKLFSQQDKLVKVIGRYTRSDIHGRKAVLSLIQLAIQSAGHPIREIHFPAILGKSYVTANASAVHRVTQQFLGVQASRGPRGLLKKRSSSRSTRHHSSSGTSGLVNIASLGKTQALKIAQGVRGIRIYYPTLGVSDSSFSINSPRAYKICGPHGKCWASFRYVISRNLIGEYYGVQGTTWTDPPILKSPDVVKKYGHRKLELFYDGDRLRLVAWRDKDAVYWVSNTLLQSLTKRQMIDIARTAKSL